MAYHGAVLRPSAIVARAREHARSTRKALNRFARPSSFSKPPDAEAAAVRVVRNIRHFRFHYAVVLWVVLLLALAPRRRTTLFFLMAMSKVAGLLLVLLRALPIPRARALNRVFVAAVLVVLLLEVVRTDALRHLLAALVIGVPLVFAHAVFRVGDSDLQEGSAAAASGDSASTMEKKGDDDVESHP